MERWIRGVLSENRCEDSRLTDQETHPTVKAEILDISVQQDMLWTMDAQYSFSILSIFYYMLVIYNFFV